MQIYFLHKSRIYQREPQKLNEYTSVEPVTVTQTRITKPSLPGKIEEQTGCVSNVVER